MKWARDKINYYCIMFEGMFNLMGVDLLGLNSIIPLFLLDYGASTAVIGLMTTIQTTAQAAIPFLLGGIAVRAKSKKKLSIMVNSIARGVILLIPLLLLTSLPDKLVVVLFLTIMFIYFVGGPLHGLSWNYLISDCVSDGARSRLLGVLFSISGMISFGTSYYIKYIRDSQSLSTDMKYIYIFGAAGIAFLLSVFSFIPLKENAKEDQHSGPFQIKEYVSSILACYKVEDFKKLLRARFFSQASMILNAFLFIFASNSLKLPGHVISNLIIIQTVGVIVGGFTTGHIGEKFGVKRMLIVKEIIGLMVPIIGTLCFVFEEQAIWMGLCIFAFGFSKSGMLGFSNYIIQVVDKNKVIQHVVANGLILLPLSILSTLAGIYIQSHSMLMVFMVQMVVSAIAVLMCFRLRLVKVS